MDSSGSFWAGLLLGIAIMWASHTWGSLWKDPNEVPTFGKTGLPKNCKAVVQAGLDFWHAGQGQSNAEGALASIERNCGANGYSWDTK